jgi:shikimate 5-dehydrogenase/shikimate kinase/3-dehydroquinate dehydratase
MVEFQHGERASRSAPQSPRLANKLALAAQGGHSTTSGANTPQTWASTSLRTRNFHPDASLVLVGIRGSGKRSLGLIAAAALGRRFVTEDHFFQSTTGLSRQDYLKVHGSEEFHRQDVDITRRMLEDNKFNAVIDCGLGSLTSSLQEFLKLFSLTNPVVYLIRDHDQIRALLNLGERSAKLLQSADPSHRKCSNYEFFNLQEDAPPLPSEDVADRASPTYSFKLRQAQQDFSKFARLITGQDQKSAADSPFSIDVAVEHRAYTYALEIPLSSFDSGLDFGSLNSIGDIVEVVVDHWPSNAPKTLSKLVATARRYLQCPVAVSVRLPAVLPEAKVSILHQCLRLGLEYMTLDLQLSPSQLAGIFALRGHSKIIGALREYAPTPLGWRDPALTSFVKKAATLQCDLVRIVLPASSSDDLASLHWFREELRSRHGIRIPIIAYNTGQSGRTTQLLNATLTSVSYESPQDVSGRLSSATTLTPSETTAALFACFVLDPLAFCIVGGNVGGSLSPPMHNAAYAALGLRHHYSTRNITSWEDIEQLSQDNNFGGCSVVQPWKVKVVAKLASLSHHAQAIGAVNTLMPLRADLKGELMPLNEQAYHRNRAGKVKAWYGENTDYIGIMVCLGRSLSPRNVIQPKTTGLVIGAGGMARAAVYAMLQMGCRNVFVYNRTVANAETLASHFNNLINSRAGGIQGLSNTQVRVLEDSQQTWPVGYSMPTMVVSCVTHEQLDGNPGADFQMPAGWLESPSGGAVIEMAYMTKETALIRQMKNFRDRTGLPWVTVDGIETLIEQAIAQFQIMTGRKAPRTVMTTAIRAELKVDHQYVADGEEYIT